MNKVHICLANLAALLCFMSCSSDELVSEQEVSIVKNEYQEFSKKDLMAKFASVLSEVVADQEEVRSFFRSEALEEFDCNYDILWAKVRGEILGDKTLRDRIIEKSSEEFVLQLEMVVPQLNILFPELPKDISAKTYDASDNELPVALRGENNTALYYDGLIVDSLSFDEIPLFPVLVVNENKRVRVNSSTRSSSMEYSFICPEYDNTRMTRSANEEYIASVEINQSKLYDKAKEAYKYFYSVESGVNSKEYQRDYIYYGVTPNNLDGHFNKQVKEYISFIKVDANIFYKLADYQPKDDSYSDPKSKEERQRGKSFSDKQKKEFLTRCWTENSFDFVFTFIRSFEASTSACAAERTIHISAHPSDLFEFDTNIDLDTYIDDSKIKKGNLWHHGVWRLKLKESGYKYMISKPYYIPLRKVQNIGNWDISKESMVRYVSVFEYDPEEEVTYEETQQFTFVNKNVWNVKVQGTYGAVSGEVSYTNENSKTQTYTQKVIRTRHTGSDELTKNMEINYSDAIINNISKDSTIVLKVYNADGVTFGIAVTNL